MQRRQQSGFTLLEVVIAAGILSIALAGAAMVSRTGNEAHETGAATQALERVAHGALERVASELARTSADSLEPDPVEGLAYSDLEFQAVLGQADGVPVLDETSRLLCELDSGELNDGVDNDGDGLIDEQRLVLVRRTGSPDEQRVVLCRGVLEYFEGETFNGLDDNGNSIADEPGFHLERDGSILTTRISVGKRGPQGRVLVRSVELATRMRN